MILKDDPLHRPNALFDKTHSHPKNGLLPDNKFDTKLMLELSSISLMYNSFQVFYLNLNIGNERWNAQRKCPICFGMPQGTKFTIMRT